MRFFQRCKFCKKRRFIIKNQPIRLPIGGIVVSKDPMCKHCARIVEKAATIK